MDRLKKISMDRCDDVQKQIFHYLLDDNKKNDFDPSVQEHIQHCKVCSHFVQIFQAAEEYLPQKPLADLKPDSNISRHILEYQDVKKHLRKKSVRSIREKIFDLFSYRIPVYQVVSGIMIVFFASMLLFGGVFAPHDSGDFLPSVKLERNGVSDLYLVDSLEQRDSLRGQNAQEDSVLMKFLVPSL